MAQKRYTITNPRHSKFPRTEQELMACFMADLLDGSVVATSLAKARGSKGELVLNYEDPNSAKPQGRANPGA